MPSFRVAPLAMTVAAVLAGTAGFCTFNLPPEPAPVFAPAISPPVRILPEAIIPHPLPEPE